MFFIMLVASRFAIVPKIIVCVAFGRNDASNERICRDTYEIESRKMMGFLERTKGSGRNSIVLRRNLTVLSGPPIFGNFGTSCAISFGDSVSREVSPCWNGGVQS